MICFFFSLVLFGNCNYCYCNGNVEGQRCRHCADKGESLITMSLSSPYQPHPSLDQITWHPQNRKNPLLQTKRRDFFFDFFILYYWWCPLFFTLNRYESQPNITYLSHFRTSYFSSRIIFICYPSVNNFKCQLMIISLVS